MIIPSEFTVVCHRLESELQKAGLVFGDAQFDESEQALRMLWKMDSGSFPDQRRRIPGTDRPSMQECCGIF